MATKKIYKAYTLWLYTPELEAARKLSETVSDGNLSRYVREAIKEKNLRHSEEKASKT